MAAGLTARERDLSRLLNGLFDRIRRLERPVSIRIGGAGGAIGGKAWTLSVDSDGNLVATNDEGTKRIIAAP